MKYSEEYVCDFLIVWVYSAELCGGLGWISLECTHFALLNLEIQVSSVCGGAFSLLHLLFFNGINYLERYILEISYS